MTKMGVKAPRAALGSLSLVVGHSAAIFGAWYAGIGSANKDFSILTPGLVAVVLGTFGILFGTFMFLRSGKSGEGRVAELADARDLKSRAR